MNDVLIHLYLGFMLFLSGGVVWGIRRLERRARIARGERN